MIPATLPARCWCGRSGSRVRGCLFHSGDLEQRVDRLMREVSVSDIDSDLVGHRKWLAFVCAGIMWHLLPRATCGRADARRLGDLVVAVTPAGWEARQAIAADELEQLHAAAVKGEWAW